MGRMAYWLRNLSKRLREWGFGRTMLYYISELTTQSGIERIWVWLVSKFPIKDILVFECESDMDDNARAFFDYLSAHGYGKRYRMVWIVKDLAYCAKCYAAENVRFVSREDYDVYERLRFLYYRTRARFFFLTHPYWLTNWRQGQTVINLDHGAAPVKGKGKNDRIGETFDYLLAASEHVAPWKAAFWHCPKEKILVLGGPRNDWIFSGTREKTVLQFIPTCEDEKVVIIMPTFRQTGTWSDCEKIDRYCMSVVTQAWQMEQLNAALQEMKIQVLVKIHPLQSLECLDTRGCSNIHYLTNGDLLKKDVRLNELLGCCDALITDFSSVYFDFLLTDRPVGFFVNDTENYTRGLIMDNPEDYMPGERIADYDDLARFLRYLADGRDGFAQERKRVNDLINRYQDDKNCERLAAYLEL